MSYPLLQGFNDTFAVTDLDSRVELLREIQQLLIIGRFFKGVADGKYSQEFAQAFQLFKRTAFLEYPTILGKSTALELLEIDGIGKHPVPKEAIEAPPKISLGKSFVLPGGRTVYCNAPILVNSNFTWGEATKNGDRIPATTNVVQQIAKVTLILDKIRPLFDNRPMFITSWYRPPTINRAVGGVSNSRHILGDGVDFIVQGVNPLDVYKKVSPWLGAAGGLGKSSQFTHIDARGYQARWVYGR